MGKTGTCVHIIVIVFCIAFLFSTWLTNIRIIKTIPLVKSLHVQIGNGTFSVVHEVRMKRTKEMFAAKRISRKDLHPSDAIALQDEIEALQQVTKCEEIVTLFNVFDEPDYSFLVFEIMEGGDLIDRIVKKQHYTEFDAKEVSQKLLMGVNYCHKKKIANRDLKPENVLLKAGSDTNVKISDFGYAKKVTFPNSLRTQCGTEGYVAPEILEHRPAYDVSCDMWSLGVIIYIVLGGYRPFRGEGEDVMRQIRYGDYKFHKRYWSHVSDDAKNLIKGMFLVQTFCQIFLQGNTYLGGVLEILCTNLITSRVTQVC